MKKEGIRSFNAYYFLLILLFISYLIFVNIISLKNPLFLVLTLLPLGVIGASVIVLRPTLGIYAVLFLLPLEAIQIIYRNYITVGKLVFLFTIIGYFFYFLIYFGRLKLNLNTYFKLYTLFVIYSFFNFIFRYEKGVPIRFILSLISVYILSFIFLQLINTRKKLENAYIFLGISFCISTLVSILQFITKKKIVPHAIITYDVATGIGKYSGTFLNPNTFACFTILTLFIYLFFMNNSATKWKKIIFRFTFFAVLISIFFINSTAGYLAIISSVFTYTFLKSKNKSLIIAFFIFFLMLFLAIPNPITERLSYRFKSEGKWRDNSTNKRLILWTEAIHMFKDNPIFGIGFAKFKIGNKIYNEKLFKSQRRGIIVFDVAHNDYLNILSENGIIGLGLYLSMIFSIIYKLYKKYKNCNDEYLKKWYISSLSTIVGLAIFQMFHTVYYINIVNLTLIAFSSDAIER